MASINRWILSTDTNGVSPTGSNGLDSAHVMRQCSSLMGRAAQGGCAANLRLAVNPVAATAVLTCTGTGANTETVTIANVVITIVTSGATGNQVNVAANATALGAAIAALVNSSSSWTGICTASSAIGVITLTASIQGTMGNGLQLSETSSSITLTSAFGAAVAGSEGTAATFKMGL